MLASNPLARTTVTTTTDASSPTCEDDALFYALLVLWSATESHRVGQLAFLSPFEELLVGRGDLSPRKFARFGWHRPGMPLVVQPGQEFLEGDKISRIHLLLVASAVGVEMKKLGRKSTRVNGKECGETTMLQEGDRILIAKQVLLLVVRRPLRLPASPSLPAREIHPFGEPDAENRIGESLQAWLSRNELDDAARFDKHVLIQGETGTGKELAAFAIHTRSKRASGPYMSLNITNVPSKLIDSEMFGIKANYPNPGTPASDGVFGDAEHGRVFLDEVGDCSFKMQTKLLRALDPGECRRVGESKFRRVDVRIVAATNKGDEAFRKDFRGRFQMVVRLLPLRERKEDIPHLVRHLLVRAAASDPERRDRLFFQGLSGRLEPRLSGFFVEYLVGHALERNTRELDEILLQALITSKGEEITLPGLDAAQEPAATGAPASGPASAGGRAGVKTITKEQVLAALRHYMGNVSQAAKALGVGRTAMYELMERFGIKRGVPTA